MDKKKLDIIGISSSQTQSGAYALILSESGGRRRLPIIIGGFEAQAIAIELEKMQPQRPLTHDLFKNFALSHGIDIKEVIINKFSEGIFYAQLVTFDGNEERTIDARTSDAVALAIRFKCPIYTFEEVLSVTGIIMEEEDEEQEFEPENDKGTELEIYNLSELQEMLDEAVENEEYERASKIRDEMSKRKEAGEEE